MSKYLYDSNGAYIGSFFDEIENQDILKSCPGGIISNEFFEYSKIENGKIISMNQEEIEKFKYSKYKNKEYELKSNEIIENESIKEISLGEYEYINEGVLKYDFEKKREFLLNKTKTYEQIEKEKSFEFKGFLQPNRELEDQSSLMKIIMMLQATKQNHFSNWKMKDNNGNEHYVDLTLKELMEMAMIMSTQTTQAMIKWSKIREQIKTMNEEELKTYELTRE
ncbi:hypothetical protein [Streptobacillus canis]|uniref:hypothetical protein n=1 Tax=Streptobacillus canis TaxID=2678686 RepID=UPI0012E2454F|nr:hypothetical protein [Streptobacillus canis]